MTPSEFIGTTAGLSDEPGAYLNLLADPSNPFNTNATLEVYNVASFVNNGSGVTWIPEDTILQATAGLSVANNINVPSEYDNYELTVPSTNVHQIVSFTDPLTGDTRLIVADDQGVFTGVINADGSINYGPGVTTNADGTVDSSDDPNGASPTFSRNGNLAIAQLESGASQASLSAITNQVTTLFYGNGLNVGQVSSSNQILNNGDTVYTGDTNGSSLSSASNPGVTIGVPSTHVRRHLWHGRRRRHQALTGANLVYRFDWGSFGGNKTDFFQVSINGGPFISRTTGLVQGADDPEWPGEPPVYANNLVMGNFAVNPIDGDQVLIGSETGVLYSTSNEGITWQSIGSLDGSYVSAPAYRTRRTRTARTAPAASTTSSMPAPSTATSS